MMYHGLPFGKTITGSLVHVASVNPTDKSTLVCPYCYTPVKVRSAKGKPAYFAHRGGKPCDSASHILALLWNRLLLLPYMPRLTPHQKQILRELFIYQMDSFERVMLKPTLLFKELSHVHIASIQCPTRTLDVLLETGFVAPIAGNRYAETYVLTTKAKVYSTQLDLKAYHQLLQDSQKTIQETVEFEPVFLDSIEPSTHTKIIQALYDRVMQPTFYFLQIQADKEKLYLVGMTDQAYETVAKKVTTYLKKHFQKIAIKPLYWMEAMGAMASYFKQRFERHRYTIGKTTDYFQFKRLVDLQKVKEELHQLYLTTPAHQAKIKKALEGNNRVGKRGAESVEKFLQKPLSQSIIECLEMGLSIRQAAYECGCAKDTVSKVKRLWKKEEQNKEEPKVIDMYSRR